MTNTLTFLRRCQDQILCKIFFLIFEVDNHHHMLGHPPHTHHHLLVIRWLSPHASSSPPWTLPHISCTPATVHNDIEIGSFSKICTLACHTHHLLTLQLNWPPQNIASEVFACAVFACQKQKVMISSWTYNWGSYFCHYDKKNYFWRKMMLCPLSIIRVLSDQDGEET